MDEFKEQALMYKRLAKTPHDLSGGKLLSKTQRYLIL